MFAIFLGSCGSKVETDFAAAEAAKGYYEQLLKGEYDAYVSAMLGGDSLPADYREQMVANAKMFVDNQQKLHRGVSRIDVQNCLNDSLTPTAQAFLLLTYGDNTSEEVVVPMVKRGERWLMK